MSTERPSDAFLSREEWQALATQVLKSCGYGSLLVVGAPGPEFLRELLKQGVDARAVVVPLDHCPEPYDFAPSRVRVGDPRERLDPGGKFATIVFVARPPVTDHWCADDAFPTRLLSSGRSILLLLPGPSSASERSRWNARFRAAGGRLHPLSHEIVSWAGAPGTARLLFERVAGGASAILAPESPPAIVDATLTEEVVARAARYALASRFVRAGDRVLDLAPADGEGSYLLSRAADASIVAWNVDAQGADAATEAFGSAGSPGLLYQSAPPQGMTALATCSVDFLVSDGAAESVALSVAEARRALTPGGRLFLCRQVPPEGGDAIAEVMSATTGNGLLLECSWLQHGTPDREDMLAWDPVMQPPGDMVPVGGDWVLLLFMRSVTDELPDKGPADAGHQPNVTAFSRDYANPWLVRGLVAIGMRATSARLRALLGDEVLLAAPDASADRGAALCVRCYLELEREAPAEILREWMQRALAYTQTQALNPTMVRWQVSLLYVAGLMAMQVGDLVLAESIFVRTANADALSFSPLLGTKTVSAAFRAGLIAFARDDIESAGERWSGAVRETFRLLRDGDWREVIVDLERPETFGLPEVAAFVMEGARAAGGLRALRDYPDKPSLVWQALHGTQVDALQMNERRLRLLEAWMAEHDRQRDGWIDELERAKAWLARQATAWEEEARSASEQAKAAQQRLEQFATDKEWFQQQSASWEAAARSGEEQLLQLTRQYTELEGAKAWLEQQAASWKAAVRSRDEQILQLTEQYSELEGAKAWLEQQAVSWMAAVRARDEQILQLTEQYGELERAKAWIEQQAASWEAEVRSRDTQLKVLMEEYAQVEQAKAWLEDQVSVFKATVESANERLNSVEAGLTLRDQRERSLTLYNSELRAQQARLEERVEALRREIYMLAKASNSDIRRLKVLESSRLFKFARKLGLIKFRE